MTTEFNKQYFIKTLEELNSDITIELNQNWTDAYNVLYKGAKIALYSYDGNGIVECNNNIEDDLYLGTVEQIVVCIMKHVFDIK